MSKQDFNEYDNQGKKGMSGIAKIISIIIVLLLLGGLTFAIFSFVDHSKKANERLNNETKQEQKR
ncbi:DUF4887 domain-containing protein [Staphylococcus warneri]